MSNKVSIIIPCYQQAQFLPEALESVLNQTHTNWECIIINDGSPDNTEEVSKQWVNFDSRFKYISQANGGTSSAKNTGIKFASGDFIQFLDADDILEKDKFKVQLSVFDTQQQFDLIYSPVRYFRSGDKTNFYKSLYLTNEDWMPQISGSLFDVFKHLIIDNIFAINCPLIKRSVIEKVGLFNENLTTHEDFDYWIRVALSGFYFHLDVTPLTFALVRVHPESVSNQKERMNTGLLVTKGYFLKELISDIRFRNDIIIKEYRRNKKQLTHLFLKKQIGSKLYKELLNKDVLHRMFFLPLVPNKLKYFFLTIDKYTLLEKIF